MHKLALALASLLLAAAAARALTSGYQQRLEALQAEAAAQRQKLGLDADRAALFAKYPTPEVTFESELVPVGCGKSAQVAIAGRFTKGSSVVVRRDDVRASGEKLAENQWRATLHASPEALPGPIEIEVVNEVSGATASKQVGEVRGQLALTLRFEDGWRAVLTPKADAAHEVRWTKGELSRISSAQVNPEQGRIRVAFAHSDEEVAALTEQSKELSTGLMTPELQAAMEKMQACAKEEQAAQMGCIQRVQPELQRVSEQNSKRLEAMKAAFESKRPKDAWACDHVELRGPLLLLEGSAECPRPLKVTATATCTAPAPE